MKRVVRKKAAPAVPTVIWEDVTPELAAKYLARNVSNRNLRESTIKAYERDMRSGNWISTHQGIAFNDAGDLIDGQHRLSAITVPQTLQILEIFGRQILDPAQRRRDAYDGCGRPRRALRP